VEEDNPEGGGLEGAQRRVGHREGFGRGAGEGELVLSKRNKAC